MMSTKQNFSKKTFREIPRRFSSSQKSVFFAVGGTGGHIFPAQALAKELKERTPELDIIFAGGNLGSNPYFNKCLFSFKEISSATPFFGGVLNSFFKILKGVFQSLKLIKESSPKLIVGFGSYYSFPILVAARLKRIPYILVESNVSPGKVNRFFSSGAKLSALQFKETSQKLKGKTIHVKIPHWSKAFHEGLLSKEEVKKEYNLHSDMLTILIFGGSQGAEAINEAVLGLSIDIPFQVIHLCGKDQNTKTIKEAWNEKKIHSVVKHFEEKMHLVWKAADVVICRAGAGTCSEVIEYEIPALFIPWPGASENHQAANANILYQKGGALFIQQEELKDFLESSVQNLIENYESMKKKLKNMKQAGIEELKTAVERELL